MKYLFKIIDVLLFAFVALMFMFCTCIEHFFYILWETKKKGGFREDIIKYASGWWDAAKNLRGFVHTLYLNSR